MDNPKYDKYDYSSMIGYVRQSTDLCWSLVTHQKDATNCANRRSLPLTSHDLISNKKHCTQPYLPYLVLRSQLERLGPRGAASSQPVLVKVMGGRRVGWDVSRGIPKFVGFGTLQLLCRCRYCNRVFNVGKDWKKHLNLLKSTRTFHSFYIFSQNPSFKLRRSDTA